jgi:AMP-binding enzyme
MKLRLTPRKSGDRMALVTADREFTFAEIDGLSGALAHSLLKLSVTPGDRVTPYAPNAWEWIVGYYGAFRAGAIINPINVMLTPAEVRLRHPRLRREGAVRQSGQDLRRRGGGGVRPEDHAFGEENLAGATPFDELIAKLRTFETVKVDVRHRHKLSLGERLDDHRKPLARYGAMGGARRLLRPAPSRRPACRR